MRRTWRVALLLDSGRAFDRGLLAGIARYVAMHHPWTLLRPAAFYQRFSGLLNQSLGEIRRCRPDGVIMNYSPLGKKVLALGVPVILVPVQRLLPGASHLLCENREAAILAADHLIGLGLRHFAFAGFDRAIWSLERREAFCRRVNEHGFSVSSHLVPLSASKALQSRCEAAVIRWLKALPKPVGIMACNDDFARSLAELCRRHGVSVPDEAALIGVDNDELICELCSPPLSSVAFATERAGYAAAELLERLMSEKHPVAVNLPVPASHVIARPSTDLLAIADAEVVKALRYIRGNADRIIRVRDVVAATFLSHRTLHDRFQRAVGHSLIKEINRQRAAHIARLLVCTQDPIGRIARSVGYYNAAHMSRYFQREMGVSPRAYRLQRQGRVLEARGC